MSKRKRSLHQWKHPLDADPFEAFLFGSWQAVEKIKIESGIMTLHFKDNHRLTMEKGPSSDIRIRSRKATMSDCCCFLRIGSDICVLSAPKCGDGPDEFTPEPVWADARINSIQRNPHDSECSCQYYVNFYVNQGSLGTQRTIRKEVEVVGINQISILQVLDRNSSEDSPYRWDSSMDCSSAPQTKLLLGKFLSDVSWLTVASVLRKVSFDIRSVDNKIVYQVLGGDVNASSSYTASNINVVNFKVGHNCQVQPFVAQVDASAPKRIGYTQDYPEDEAPPSNVKGLRRSKRRHIQPERYIGCEVSELLEDVGPIRMERPYKVDTWKGDEEPVPLACEPPSFQEKCPKEVAVNSNGQKFDKWNTGKEIKVYQRRNKTKEAKLGGANQPGHHTPLAIIPSTYKADPVPDMHLSLIDKDNTQEIGDAEKVDEFSSRSYYSYGAPKLHRKNSFGPDDMDIEPSWEGINPKNRVQEKRYYSTYSRSRNHDEERGYRDRTLNAASYKEMIDSYLKNIDKIPTEEEEPTTIEDQWFGTSNCEQRKEEGTSQQKDDEEMYETDKLWQEMETSLTSIYLHEERNVADVLAETTENSRKICEHDNRLDEEIGIYCIRCGVVSEDIKSITPDFLPRQKRLYKQEEKQCKGEQSVEPKADKDDKADEDDWANEDDCDLKLFENNASTDELVPQENESIWGLIPELREKMHGHQKRAFEFLWQNISGSMEPPLMESKNSGGCVISHSPGAGKTFLIIAFLVSYLKLFPGTRPLVLAPKTTLYTWYKEFTKWEIPIPVYLIHGRRSQREFNVQSVSIPGVPKPTNDVKHVLDCLQKFQKWHDHPSVLVMGYTSFLSLMREDSKFAHRQYMAKVLRESPGMLILDEGHNPRSTKSSLRKALMQVETELRVLLSGTLFQNNFCEYFNTLCLARPKFVTEVLTELDINYEKRKIAEKARHLIEARARKFFLDQIANRIDSSDSDERMEGLNLLRKLTNGFIDVYDGGNYDTLPGLQLYTLLMNTTDIQDDILRKLHAKMAHCNGYPLELELLITLASIHPWLVKTAACAAKFFSSEQLKELDKYKTDLKKGSKVRFVLNLVNRVFKKEKILIFCHNIAPVKLLVELFEMVFKWRKDREILVLNGEMELFERGKVIDKFEEPYGASRVLFASITACAEGISLTAASRVIMLDSEWNPSKTKQAIARAFRPGQQKMVYVYQLLAFGSLEEDKHRRTTWKEWVSSMIFSEDFVEDPSQWQAQKIEDDVLREMVEGDKSKSIRMIMKNEKASTN